MLHMAWPTTDDPRDYFVTARLTQKERDDLDAAAKVNGESRSGALRTALSDYVEKTPKTTSKKGRT